MVDIERKGARRVSIAERRRGGGRRTDWLLEGAQDGTLRLQALAPCLDSSDQDHSRRRHLVHPDGGAHFRHVKSQHVGLRKDNRSWQAAADRSSLSLRDVCRARRVVLVRPQARASLPSRHPHRRCRYWVSATDCASC